MSSPTGSSGSAGEMPRSGGVLARIRAWEARAQPSAPKAAPAPVVAPARSWKAAGTPTSKGSPQMAQEGSGETSAAAASPQSRPSPGPSPGSQSSAAAQREPQGQPGNTEKEPPLPSVASIKRQLSAKFEAQCGGTGGSSGSADVPGPEAGSASKADGPAGTGGSSPPAGASDTPPDVYEPGMTPTWSVKSLREAMEQKQQDSAPSASSAQRPTLSKQPSLRSTTPPVGPPSSLLPPQRKPATPQKLEAEQVAASTSTGQGQMPLSIGGDEAGCRPDRPITTAATPDLDASSAPATPGPSNNSVVPEVPTHSAAAASAVVETIPTQAPVLPEAAAATPAPATTAVEAPAERSPPVKQLLAPPPSTPPPAQQVDTAPPATVSVASVLDPVSLEASSEAAPMATVFAASPPTILLAPSAGGALADEAVPTDVGATLHPDVLGSIATDATTVLVAGRATSESPSDVEGEVPTHLENPDRDAVAAVDGEGDGDADGDGDVEEVLKLDSCNSNPNSRGDEKSKLEPNFALERDPLAERATTATSAVELRIDAKSKHEGLELETEVEKKEETTEHERKEGKAEEEEGKQEKEEKEETETKEEKEETEKEEAVLDLAPAQVPSPVDDETNLEKPSPVELGYAHGHGTKPLPSADDGSLEGQVTYNKEEIKTVEDLGSILNIGGHPEENPTEEKDSCKEPEKEKEKEKEKENEKKEEEKSEERSRSCGSLAEGGPLRKASPSSSPQSSSSSLQDPKNREKMAFFEPQKSSTLQSGMSPRLSRVSGAGTMTPQRSLVRNNSAPMGELLEVPMDHSLSIVDDDDVLDRRLRRMSGVGLSASPERMGVRNSSNSSAATKSGPSEAQKAKLAALRHGVCTGKPRLELSNSSEQRVLAAGIKRLEKELTARRDDITKLPTRKNGSQLIMTPSFFLRLLSKEFELKSCAPSDVSSSQRDLRYLDCDQLLCIRAGTLDFVTESGSHSAHSNFLASLDSHLFGKLAQRCITSPQPPPNASEQAWRFLSQQLVLIVGAAATIAAEEEKRAVVTGKQATPIPDCWAILLDPAMWPLVSSTAAASAASASDPPAAATAATPGTAAAPSGYPSTSTSFPGASAPSASCTVLAAGTSSSSNTAGIASGITSEADANSSGTSSGYRAAVFHNDRLEVELLAGEKPDFAGACSGKDVAIVQARADTMGKDKRLSWKVVIHKSTETDIMEELEFAAEGEDKQKTMLSEELGSALKMRLVHRSTESQVVDQERRRAAARDAQVLASSAAAAAGAAARWSTARKKAVSG